MLKKLSFAIFIGLLTACGSSSTPKYQITNEQFQYILLSQNNVEQCIYPQLQGLSYAEAEREVYSRQSPAEKFVLAKYLDDIVRFTIGDIQYGIFISDEASQKYFNDMHKKHNHQLATGMNYQECEVLKARFYNEVQNFRGY